MMIDKSLAHRQVWKVVNYDGPKLGVNHLAPVVQLAGTEADNNAPDR